MLLIRINKRVCIKTYILCQEPQQGFPCRRSGEPSCGLPNNLLKQNDLYQHDLTMINTKIRLRKSLISPFPDYTKKVLENSVERMENNFLSSSGMLEPSGIFENVRKHLEPLGSRGRGDQRPTPPFFCQTRLIIHVESSHLPSIQK